MDGVELVCVSCRKVDCGNGVWSTLDNPSSGEQKNSLCPECCRQRFPQFYSDFKRPAKRRPVVGGMLSTIANLIKT
jgi:hypothetical protein